jgi:hypothetical protein
MDLHADAHSPTPIRRTGDELDGSAPQADVVTDDGELPGSRITPLVIRVRTASDVRGRSPRRARVPSRFGEQPRSA